MIVISNMTKIKARLSILATSCFLINKKSFGFSAKIYVFWRMENPILILNTK